MPIQKNQMHRLMRISALLKENRYPNSQTLIEEFRRISLEEGLEIECGKKTILRDMCNEGCAIFFSTHVLEVAEKLCDKIAIIKNGKLIMSGDTETVKGDDSLEDVFLELAEEPEND